MLELKFNAFFIEYITFNKYVKIRFVILFNRLFINIEKKY